MSYQPNEVYQRVPTQEQNKKKVLDMLEAISIKYNDVLVGLQQGIADGKRDGLLTKDFYSYISFVITLYTTLKAKLPSIKQSIPDIEDLEIIDVYLMNLAKAKPNNLDQLYEDFLIFTKIEEILRNACEELGYTSDNPETQRK